MSTPDGESRFGGNSNPAKPKSSGSSGNVFTRKLGPLPLWAWMGIGLAIALGFYFWQQQRASASSSASNVPGPDNTTAAGQIPQFVNITQNTTAPSTPSTGTTTPAPGPKPVKGVPDLAGMSRATAEATLKNIGLEWRYEPEKGKGFTKTGGLLKNTGYTVIGQNPPAGAQTQPGEKVILTVEESSEYEKKHKQVQ